MAELQMRPTAMKPLNSSNSQILVVDDNVDAAHTLARLLNVLGYSANSAYGGEAAIAAIELCAPGLVFLDLGMPRMDGIETANRIGQLPNGREITLVAMTGYEREEDLARTQAAGFKCHLVKPVNLNALERLLAELIGVPTENRRQMPR